MWLKDWWYENEKWGGNTYSATALIWKKNKTFISLQVVSVLWSFCVTKRGGETVKPAKIHTARMCFCDWMLFFSPGRGSTSSCCLQYKAPHNVKHQTTYEGEAISHRCLFQLAVNQFWHRNQRHRWFLLPQVKQNTGPGSVFFFFFFCWKLVVKAGDQNGSVITIQIGLALKNKLSLALP